MPLNQPARLTPRGETEIIYIHETTQVIPGKLDEFVGLFEETYHPAMSKAGARLVALWETVAISLPWPRTIALWEVDNLKHYAGLAKDQYGSGELGPRFRAWRQALGKVSTRRRRPYPGARRGRAHAQGPEGERSFGRGLRA